MSSWFTLRGGLWIVFYVVLTGILLQNAFFIFAPDLNTKLSEISTITGFIFFIATILCGVRKNLRDFFGSTKIAVAVLSFVAIYCILGTVILQNVSDDILTNTYGNFLSSFFRMVKWNDIFHSFSFSALLGVGAGGIFLALLRTKKFSLKTVAKFLAHLSILIILAGTSIGSLWGIKGEIGISKGEIKNSFYKKNNDGSSGVEIPLGFGIKLNNFKIEHYRRNMKLRVFDSSRETPKLLSSITLDKEKEWNKLKTFGAKILSYFPDFEEIIEARPADNQTQNENQKVSALCIEFYGKRAEKKWLIASKDSSLEKFQIGDKTELLFVQTEKQAQQLLEEFNAPPGGRHLIEIGEKKIEIKIGETYQINENKFIKIEQFYNDFVIDIETKKPYNRSEKPDNPAIEVSIVDEQGNIKEKGWLFSNFASFHQIPEDSILKKIKYHYISSQSPDENITSILVIGESEEILFFRGGKIQSRKSIKNSLPFGLDEFGVKIIQIIPNAKIEKKQRSKSREPQNPVVKISIEGEKEPVLLAEGEPLELPDGKVILMSEQGDNIKDYLSTVSIIEGARVIKTQIIEVGSPLSYRGYKFYQSGYNPSKPDWTLLMVSKDQGVWFVWTGLILLLLSVVILYIVVPIYRRRTQVNDENLEAED